MDGHCSPLRFRARPYVIAPTEPRPGTDQPLCGRVHDENAEYLGGVAGHAGVFSTAADLAAFCRALLDAHHGDAEAFVTSPGHVREAWRPWAPYEGRARGLAWIAMEPPGGTGDRVVYHHGFTGTSIFLVPDRDEYVVLLTNRVRVSRERAPMGRVRDTILHTLADPADEWDPSSSSLRAGAGRRLPETDDLEAWVTDVGSRLAETDRRRAWGR